MSHVAAEATTPTVRPLEFYKTSVLPESDHPGVLEYYVYSSLLFSRFSDCGSFTLLIVQISRVTGFWWS